MDFPIKNNGLGRNKPRHVDCIYKLNVRRINVFFFWPERPAK